MGCSVSNLHCESESYYARFCVGIVVSLQSRVEFILCVIVNGRLGGLRFGCFI